MTSLLLQMAFLKKGIDFWGENKRLLLGTQQRRAQNFSQKQVLRKCVRSNFWKGMSGATNLINLLIFVIQSHLWLTIPNSLKILLRFRIFPFEGNGGGTLSMLFPRFLILSERGCRQELSTKSCLDLAGFLARWCCLDLQSLKEKIGEC